MIYLDSAAVVKLVHAEAESAALRGWLDERAETGWISSVLTEIESFRALARHRTRNGAGNPVTGLRRSSLALQADFRIPGQRASSRMRPPSQYF